MRRYVTTEKKRKTLNEWWRKYDRALLKEKMDTLKRSHGSDEIRAAIEDFVHDDGETP